MMTGCASASRDSSKVNARKLRTKPETTPRDQKRSYKVQRELDMLPAEIERLETEIGEISEQMNQADFYQSERSVTAAIEKNLGDLQQQLNHCYERWELLEAQ